MKQRNRLIGILSTLLALVIGLAAFLVNATNDCGEPICLSLPSIISGQVTDDTYYTGSIELASTFHDGDPISDKAGYYTIDGVNWTSTPTTNYVPLAGVPASASAAAFSDGSLIAAWQEANAIYVRQFDKSGAPLGAKSAVATGLAAGTYLPTILTQTNDNYVVVWMTSQKLQYKMYSRQGSLIRSATVYTGDAENFVLSYRAAVTSNGNVAILAKRLNEYEAATCPGVLWWYMCVPPTYIKRDVNYYLHVFDPALGSPFTPVYTSPLVSEEGGFDVEGLATGNIVAVLQDESASTLIRFSNSGGIIGAEQPIDGSAVNPRISSAPNGEYVAIWESPADSQIYAQKFNADGVAIGVGFLVTPGSIGDLDYVEDGYYLLSYMHGGNLKFTRINPDRTVAAGTLVFPYGGATNAGLYAIGATGIVTPVSTSASAMLPFDKVMSSGVINPETDLTVQFKLVEPASGTEWLSAQRNYFYADAYDGRDGSITYPNGYSNSSSALIRIEMSCNSCTSLQLYESFAPFSGNVCGAYGEWTAYGNNSTLKREVIAAVENNRCYRYKAVVTNAAGRSFEYLSNNVLMVDRTSPEVALASEQTAGDQLSLALDIQDRESGIAAQTYQVNGGDRTPFTGNTLTASVVNGLNRITIEVHDRAGNIGVYDHFSLVDLTPPEIVIHGIEDGGVYGSDLSFAYSLTQQLTNLTMTVDGELRTDLAGLPDGVHTLKIQGYDAQGNLVEKTVTFTKDSNLFSLTLLSPQSRIYEANDIQVDFSASKPTIDVWYSLNGGPATRNMVLSGLADGVYDLVLYAKSSAGETASRSARFTVKKAIPFLQVESPVEGTVYPKNRVRVVFASDSPVTYRLGDQSGTITSGTVLTVPADGRYTLALSATHPASGNVVSQAISFETDSMEPRITINSPLSRLYTFDSIPIEYSSNKPLSDVEYILDGKTVATLTGLAAGAHTLKMRGRDSAGRLAEQQVQFNVATMEILSPQDGQKVISNTMPSQLPFSYGASGGFTSFTVALDQGAKQLLVNPPGSTTLIPAAPGNHEIALQGRLNEFTSTKRSRFTIGAMNVSAGKGSIDYRYENCDAGTNICDVYAIVRIKNTGYYDINQPITLRFDHVAGTGYQTQWQTIAALAVGQAQEWALEPFKAMLGDTFSLAVDPYREIAGEWSGDNVHTLKFQTGQITGVSQGLAQDNVYLEGVSIFNPIVVETAGSVSSVELVINGWTFIDNDASDGFNLLADMGLLGSAAECMQVIARNDAQIVMDSQSLCFETKALAFQDTARFTFPWDQYAQGAKRVNVDSLSMADIAATLASMRFAVLQKPASVMPMLSEGGIVDYRLVADPAAVQQQPYSRTVQMGSPVLGGAKPMPNGHGIFLANISTSDSTCAVDGAAPIMTTPRYEDLSELYRKELDQVNALARFDLGQLGAIEGLWVGAQWSGGAFLTFETPDLELPTDISESSNELARLFTTLYDLAPLNIKTTWLVSGWEEQLATVSEQLGVEYGFASAGCLVAADIGQVDLSLQGEYRIRVDSKTMLSVNGMDLDILGAAAVFAGDIPIPFTTTIAIGDIKVYPQTINLLADLEAKVNVAVVDQRFYVGPFSTSFNASVYHNRSLGGADIVAYPIFLGGFGLGAEVKAKLYLNGSGSADIGGGNQNGSSYFSTYEFQFSRLDGNLELCTREKYCFLGACYKTSWDCDKTPLDANPNGAEETGQSYTAEQVAAEIAAIEPIDVGSVNDLTSLGLYSLIVGDTQLAQEYLSCGVFQNIVASMPHGALYSLRTGQCAPVTDPDHEPVSGAAYYADAACQQEVDYKPTPFLTYCQNNLLSPINQQYIGNAAAWPDEGDAVYASIGKNSKWTLGHGPTLDALAVSPKNNHRPFIKQVEYRTVDGCHLEMRVYKKNILDQNLKPLMLIHGGAWKYRGFGAIGGEVLISHLTERGFIVFEPYYRLMGSSDGPAECQIPGPANGISPGEMIVEDIENALAWVKTHGGTLGAQPGARVSLVGQSAGAHLSGWLASHHGGDINKVLLFYPPTDIAYYVQEMGGKYPLDHEGRALIEEFLGGVDITAMDESNLPPFVVQNSFPELIRVGADFPPTFMIHGNADTLVPIEMSTRMCDALSHRDPAVPMPTAGGRYTCGVSRGVANILHIVDGANHILDLKCIVDPALASALGDNFKDLSKLCPSGSPAVSENVVKPAILEGLDWLR